MNTMDGELCKLRNRGAHKMEHSQVPRLSLKHVVYPGVETYNFRDKREIISKAHARGGHKSKESAYPRQIKDEVRIPKPPIVIRADVRTAPSVRRVLNRSLVALNQATPPSPPARESSSQRLLPREPPKKTLAKQLPDTPRTHLPRIKLLQRHDPAEEESEVTEDEEVNVDVQMPPISSTVVPRSVQQMISNHTAAEFYPSLLGSPIKIYSTRALLFDHKKSKLTLTCEDRYRKRTPCACGSWSGSEPVDSRVAMQSSYAWLNLEIANTLQRKRRALQGTPKSTLRDQVTGAHRRGIVHQRSDHTCSSDEDGDDLARWFQQTVTPAPPEVAEKAEPSPRTAKSMREEMQHKRVRHNWRKVITVVNAAQELGKKQEELLDCSNGATKTKWQILEDIPDSSFTYESKDLKPKSRYGAWYLKPGTSAFQYRKRYGEEDDSDKDRVPHESVPLEELSLLECSKWFRDHLESQQLRLPHYLVNIGDMRGEEDETETLSRGGGITGQLGIMTVR